MHLVTTFLVAYALTYTLGMTIGRPVLDFVVNEIFSDSKEPIQVQPLDFDYVHLPRKHRSRLRSHRKINPKSNLTLDYCYANPASFADYVINKESSESVLMPSNEWYNLDHFKGIYLLDPIGWLEEFTDPTYDWFNTYISENEFKRLLNKSKIVNLAQGEKRSSLPFPAGFKISDVKHEVFDPNYV